jgi:hypothetical protein
MKKNISLELIYAFILAVWCSSSSSVAQGQDPVLVGAGDIAVCSSLKLADPEATAELLDSIAGTVFVAGDLAYPDGTDGNFAKCYDLTWGRHRARSVPAPGNHEYNTPGATDYFNYFGPAAGDPAKGYYSFDLGTWHFVVLNSNCSVVPCGTGSAQVNWLHADLAAHPATCTIAMWHHPLFSSTVSSSSVKPFWQELYNAGADLILNGHAHNYERFAPQDPNGAADPTSGIREIIVGTGGESHASFGSTQSNSEVRNSNTFGVLKLTLHPTSYDWQFVPQAGKNFTDSGSTACH